MSARLDVLTSGYAELPKLVAWTHGWWAKDGPDHDPLGEDQGQLEQSRARLLERGPALIVPGHGEPYTPPGR
jgi:glyoxylase-like metal-dependent hydrolase (beta-lactamase superfamily II)